MDQDEIWDFCKPTFVVTLALGIGVYFTHLNPQLADSPRAPQARDIASSHVLYTEDQSPTAEPAAEYEARSLKLNCLKKLMKPLRLDTDTSQLRITGRECGRQYPISQIRIENSTNGFEASLFKSSSSTFSTDFLTIEKGTNSIKVVWQQADQAITITEVLVQRSY